MSLFGTLSSLILMATPLCAMEGKPIALLGGDSLGVGLCKEFRHLAYPKYTPICASVGGTRTNQWVQRLPGLLKKYKPAVLLLSLGTNDSGSAANHFLNHPEDINNIQVIAESYNSTLIWISPPALPDKALPFRNQVWDLIKTHVDHFYDSSWESGQSGDRIHFTTVGYRDWMQHIWLWMIDQQIVEGEHVEED